MDLTEKTAICFSGQIRTGAINLQQIMESLGDFKSRCDFFMHSWDVNTQSLWDGRKIPDTEEERNKLRNTFTKVNPADIASITEYIDPIAIKIDNFKSYKETQTEEITRRQLNMSFHPMFSSIWECNNLKRMHEIKNSSKYGRVVRLRYDMIFTMDLGDEIMYTNYKPNVLHFIDPNNKFPDCIEDICWICNSKTMNTVCDFVTEREKYASEKDMQEQMREYLDIQKIDYRPFKNNSMSLMRGNIYTQDQDYQWQPQ